MAPADGLAPGLYLLFSLLQSQCAMRRSRPRALHCRRGYDGSAQPFSQRKSTHCSHGSPPIPRAPYSPDLSSLATFRTSSTHSRSLKASLRHRAHERSLAELYKALINAALRVQYHTGRGYLKANSPARARQGWGCHQRNRPHTCVHMVKTRSMRKQVMKLIYGLCRK